MSTLPAELDSSNERAERFVYLCVPRICHDSIKMFHCSPRICAAFSNVNGEMIDLLFVGINGWSYDLVEYFSRKGSRKFPSTTYLTSRVI